MCEFYATGFAAAAGMDLRFYNHYAGSESCCAFAGFFLGKSHFPAWSSDTVTRENGLGLILMNLHRGSVVLEFWCRRKHKSVLGKYETEQGCGGIAAKSR